MNNSQLPVPLSTIAAQPWDPLRYDHGMEHIWSPIMLTVTALVGIMNGAVVLTALVNSKLRVQIALFAWNGLFFCMCTGNTIFMLGSLATTIQFWYAGQWDESLCTRLAGMNEFFMTFNVLLSICMTTERIVMVVAVRRMPPKFVIYCVGTAGLLAAGNAAVSGMRGSIIFASGLSCAHPYPLLVGITDVGLLMVAVSYLLGTFTCIHSVLMHYNDDEIWTTCKVGNILCVWKLQQMKHLRTRVMTVSSTIVSEKRPFILNSKNALAAFSSAISLNHMNNSNESRIQRQFALRGALSAFATSLTVVPMIVLLCHWSFYDQAAPRELEIASLIMMATTNLVDPLIVLWFDRKLRSVMINALMPRWFVRRFRSDPSASTVEGSEADRDPAGEIGITTLQVVQTIK
ncbi:hypothetical protein BC828DRAFT_377187 [Blastocladiella britannica]|nr:hypothetical protein BC828DRAFT_377187 [Blastocladiella britannica]